MNYGINLTNPNPCRKGEPEGAPAMVALQMVVDRMLILLNGLPVMGKARGRGIANLAIQPKGVLNGTLA